MPVEIARSVRNRLDVRALRRCAERLLEAIGEPRATLSLSFVGDGAIRTLNRRFRGIDRATDVLSFPADPPLLGDVVISIPAARRQAAAYGAPLTREIQRLLIHGILHLTGHDHHRPSERRKMEREERRLARAIGMPWPYDDAL